MQCFFQLLCPHWEKGGKFIYEFISEFPCCCFLGLILPLYQELHSWNISSLDQLTVENGLLAMEKLLKLWRNKRGGLTISMDGFLEGNMEEIVDFGVNWQIEFVGHFANNILDLEWSKIPWLQLQIIMVHKWLSVSPILIMELAICSLPPCHHFHAMLSLF